VAGVVIVGKAEYRDVALIEVLARLRPCVEFLLAVDDHLVPAPGAFLDALPVAQPAEVGEIRRDGIALGYPLLGPGIHGWSINASAALCFRKTS